MNLTSVSFVLISYWALRITFSSGSEVVFVNRNKVDSFRVGKNGCTNDSNVCPTSAICQTSDGVCQCKSSTPTYRKFIVNNGLRGLVHGCVKNPLIGLSSENESDNCRFTTSNVIPFSHNSPASIFNHDDPNIGLGTCKLVKAWTKTPNTDTETQLEWMDESYVDISVSNRSLYFKWKKSVPELQGTMIYFSLKCGEFESCLGGKVRGTWLAVNPMACWIDNSWYSRFDREGWTNCTGDNLFITGFYRNKKSIGQYIWLIEKAKCCRSVPAFTAQSSVCRTADWSTSLERRKKWSYCPQGYFLNGLYRNRGKFLKAIEYGNCCKPKSHPDKYRLCYEEDIAVSFNDEGWSNCSKTGYYITGLYRGSGRGRRGGLDNIDKFHCCQMTIEPRPISIQPTTTGAPRTTDQSERTKSTCSKDYSLNNLTKIFIGLFGLSLLVIAIVVSCMWRKKQSNQDTYFEETGMPRIDEQREEHSETKVNGYAVARRGRDNKGASVNGTNERVSDIYDMPTGTETNFNFFQLQQHNNERSSEVYEEPGKKYTTLRRNNAEEMEEQEDYQSLTPLEARK